MKSFLIEILDSCVLSDQSSALKKILNWIRDEVASNKLLRNLFLYKWYQDDKNREEGFLWNNRAFIRACQKDDFQMVSHFKGINFGKNKEI